MADQKVFDGQGADGNSSPFRIRDGLIAMSGALGGGTVQLQVQDPDGNWVDVNGESYTTLVAVHPQMPSLLKDHDCRLSLSGATAPNLTAWVLEAR